MHGVVCEFYKTLWKLKVPTKVMMVFIWLLIHDHIITRRNMLNKGLQVTPGCALCQSNDLENRDRLLWTCQFSGRFWRGLTAHMNITLNSGARTMTDASWETGNQGKRYPHHKFTTVAFRYDLGGRMLGTVAREKLKHFFQPAKDSRDAGKWNSQSVTDILRWMEHC